MIKNPIYHSSELADGNELVKAPFGLTATYLPAATPAGTNLIDSSVSDDGTYLQIENRVFKQTTGSTGLPSEYWKSAYSVNWNENVPSGVRHTRSIGNIVNYFHNDLGIGNISSVAYPLHFESTGVVQRLQYSPTQYSETQIAADGDWIHRSTGDLKRFFLQTTREAARLQATSAQTEHTIYDTNSDGTPFVDYAISGNGADSRFGYLNSLLNLYLDQSADGAFYIRNNTATRDILLQTNGGDIRVRPDNTDVLIANSSGIANFFGAIYPLDFQSTGIQQRLRYSASEYYTIQSQSTGDVNQVTSGRNWYWRCLDQSAISIMQLTGGASSTNLNLYDRSGASAGDGLNCNVRLYKDASLNGTIGYLGSTIMYVRSAVTDGNMFFETNGAGGIFLRPGAGNKLVCNSTGVGLNGATAVARAAAIPSPAADVTELKTAVDLIRTALTNIGITF